MLGSGEPLVLTWCSCRSCNLCLLIRNWSSWKAVTPNVYMLHLMDHKVTKVSLKQQGKIKDQTMSYAVLCGSINVSFLSRCLLRNLTKCYISVFFISKLISLAADVLFFISYLYTGLINYLGLFEAILLPTLDWFSDQGNSNQQMVEDT